MFALPSRLYWAAVYVCRMSKASKVLVVGSNGFLGKSASHLLQSSGKEVVSITKSNFESLIDPTFFDEHEIETVIWLASRVNPSTAQSNPELVETELLEFERVVDNCGNRITNFVFSSSGGATYSGEALPYSENSEANGVNAYGKLKCQMEKVLIESGLPYSILRISNVYGPGQVVKNAQGIIAALFDAAINERDFELFGSASNKRDFVFIDDLMNLLLRIVEKEVSSGIINVGSGKSTSISELLEIFSSLTGLIPKIHPVDARPIDRTEFWLDISKAKQHLNWSPQVSFEDGLKRTWDSLRQKT